MIQIDLWPMDVNKSFGVDCCQIYLYILQFSHTSLEALTIINIYDTYSGYNNENVKLLSVTIKYNIIMEFVIRGKIRGDIT